MNSNKFELNGDQFRKAIIWYNNHKPHIDNMLHKHVVSFPPSDQEDANKPALWKPGHWMWFIENYRDNAIGE